MTPNGPDIIYSPDIGGTYEVLTSAHTPPALPTVVSLQILRGAGDLPVPTCQVQGQEAQVRESLILVNG